MSWKKIITIITTSIIAPVLYSYCSRRFGPLPISQEALAEILIYIIFISAGAAAIAPTIKKNLRLFDLRKRR